MCGRFTLRTTAAELAKHFFQVLPINSWPPITPRYNIAPTQMVAAIRWLPGQAAAECGMFHWGLIPPWCKDAKMAARMINARGETLAEKPAFRKAFALRRCLIPADGFYEWKLEGKKKLPIHIRREDNGIFCFAGIWERWHGPQGDIESTAIITTAANSQMRYLHDRMPLILAPREYELWLRGVDAMGCPSGPGDFHTDPQLRNAPHRLVVVREQPPLVFYHANPLVNSPRVDSPECLITPTP